MGNADGLSCHSNHGDGSSDNKDVILLKPESFVVTALSVVYLEGEEAQILQDIHSAVCEKELEKLVAKAVKELQCLGVCEL